MKDLSTTNSTTIYVVSYLKGKWLTKTNFSTLEKAEFFISYLPKQKNSAKIEILITK